MPQSKRNPRSHTPSGSSPAWPEVLTLAEAAAYLRVSEAEILALVGPGGLSGRLIGSEWRFSRGALQKWLRARVGPSSRESLAALAGSWKDDPHAEQLLQAIHERRGRPTVEEEE